MTRTSRTTSMAVSALIIALTLGSASAARASSGGSATTYSKPTWWQKFETVSSHGFSTLKAPRTTGSVKVGSNVDVSNEPGPQSETAITIDPSDPSQIVAGSNEIFRLPMRGYFSSDGGSSWGAVDLPLPPPLVTNGTDFGSDPSVAWDTHGNVFYAYIVVFFSHGFPNGVAINGTEMAVARSSDGGQTWRSTFFAMQPGETKFNDKPYIAVDDNPASPHRDAVYVAWDRFDGSSSSFNGVLVSRSTDGGKSFSTPVFASSTASGPRGDVGADPFVGPDGTLHVAWHDVQNNELVEASSANGGLTFGPTRVISRTTVAFDVGIPAMAIRRALVYPACGADTSTGPHRGTIYCSWMDETPSNGTDVFVARSTDKGKTWSAPTRVNDDPTGLANDQFNQWLAVDPASGSVNVSWNDTRNDAAHLRTDIFYARSTDGGLSFSRNVQVTSAPTNETCCGADLGNQYGDYEGIAALGGSVHPVWTDRRASIASLDEEVFTATISAK